MKNVNEKHNAAKVVAGNEKPDDNNVNLNNNDELLAGSKLHSILDNMLGSIRSDIKGLGEVVAKFVAVPGA